ncbi:MAG: alpha/beta hydrolase [Polyangiaceae bacterium]|nr:alpha/beta hydrolase [Polyangiaceae bacterium]
MTKTKTRRHADDLRSVSKLAVEATLGVTGVVKAMHQTIAGGPPVLGAPFARFAGVIAGVVYEPILSVTKAVGDVIDGALRQLDPVLGESEPGPQRDALVAALNGVLGDHLSKTENPLAIPMTLRSDGQAIPRDAEALRALLPNAGKRILVMVHGCSMNYRQWTRNGHDHGDALAKEFGFTPLYLHYNSGLHVSENGQAFAEQLERVLDSWPVPIDEIAIVGHSMGGLVARSACHVAENEKHRWRTKLRTLICLGTPHHGSPIERGGSVFESLLGWSAYSTPLASLGKIRSAGVTDLRYGNVLKEHWEGRDRFAREGDTRRDLRLPEGVDCFAVAATTSKIQKDSLPGDGLVPLKSALGMHKRADLTLGFSDTWIALGTGHVDLLSSREVYEQLRKWLRR